METLDSVFRQDAELEVVISDGGSSDRTISLLESVDDDRLSIHVSQDCLTAAANWNKSVLMSSTSLVKVMGQDDVLLEGCLNRELEVMESNEHITAPFVFSRRAILAGNSLRSGLRADFGETICQLDPHQLIDFLVRSGRNPIGEPVSVTFRRSAFDQVGGFVGDYVIDLDFYLRMMQLGSPVWIPETLTAFRVSRKSWSMSLYHSQTKSILQLHRQISKSDHWTVSQKSFLIGCLKARIFPYLRRAYILLTDRKPR